MYDGSGLSRYNYVTADTIVGDPATRLGRREAARPVPRRAARRRPATARSTTRMQNTILDGRVQAKTGTISNVRSLSGFVETKSGETLVFSMIANHFTAPSAEIDAVRRRRSRLRSLSDAGAGAGRSRCWYCRLKC